MRIDRLYAITLLLMNREKITAREIAERFGVSVRTVYRDIDTLDLAGIPVITYPGIGGGIGLIPGYRLDGGYFTRGELKDLVATLEGIAPILSETTLPATMGKANALSRQSPIRSTDEDSPVSIDLTGWREHPGWKDCMSLLIGAIRTKRAVVFAYTSLKDQRLVREVEPLRVIFRNSNWYLSAWCRLREDYRWFTISRIENLRRLDSPFDRRRRLEEAPRDGAFGEPTLPIRIALTVKGAAKAIDYIHPDSLIPDGNRQSIVLNWPANEWLYGFLLSLGPEVEVLEPVEIRLEIKRRIQTALERYCDPGSIFVISPQPFRRQ